MGTATHLKEHSGHSSMKFFAKLSFKKAGKKQIAGGGSGRRPLDFGNLLAFSENCVCEYVSRIQ
jgi:hypothetical protein